MNIRPITTPADWQDSVADWAVTHQKVSEAELDRFISDRTPAPAQPMPAEACSELLADPAPIPFVFPLEPILTRHQWLGPTLIALICFVWLCLDSYLEMTP